MIYTLGGEAMAEVTVAASQRLYPCLCFIPLCPGRHSGGFLS